MTQANKWKRFFLFGAWLIATIAAPVRAGVWEDVAIGLDAAGFDLRGDRNPLSGGYEFLITNQFNGETFDFGAWELTLDGPVSLEAETGGRLVNTIDLGLSTALNSDASASPLTYELAYDVGGQQTTISGNLLMDADLRFNEFLYYDLSLQYSSRQTVVNDGSIDDGDAEFDADLGPINIRGNLVIDALAAITDPLFSAAGADNPFRPLTATAQVEKALGDSLGAAMVELTQGETAASRRGAFGPFGIDGSSSSGLEVGGGSLSGKVGLPDTTTSGVVPEPSVLILMLAGLAVLPRFGTKRATRR